MIARSIGAVVEARAGLIRARLPGAAVGEVVNVRSARESIRGVVCAVQRGSVTIVAHSAIEGVVCGDIIWSDPAALHLPLGMRLLGRAFDSSGVALDNEGMLSGRLTSIVREPLSPALRAPVTAPLWTGVRLIDGLLTIGRGARVGLFGAPGAGKSTLLNVIARGVRADAVVVGLIGERGREAEEWIRCCDKRTSIVCAASDRSAAQRVHAARITMAQADALRARGLHVLVILDSLARFGSALRELAVASGEAVGRGGFPPSVFAELARLVEIGGSVTRGSISLIATVLSDGTERDPLSEAARSLLDGHIELSSRLADAGRFPAIDVSRSSSRTMGSVIEPEHRANAGVVRKALALLDRTEDARALGIAPGDSYGLLVQNAEPAIESFLRQGDVSIKPSRTLHELAGLADTLGGTAWTSQPI